MHSFSAVATTPSRTHQAGEHGEYPAVLALQWEKAREDCPMTITDEVLFCKLAAPGIEVVTVRTDRGDVMTTIHGGRLDGERFTGQGDAESQHERACRLARMTSWARRRRSSRCL